MQSSITTLQKGLKEMQNDVKNLHNKVDTELEETHIAVTNCFDMLHARIDKRLCNVPHAVTPQQQQSISRPDSAARRVFLTLDGLTD